ncbi:MAG: hypothetical protein KGL39_57930, partial [Patescibacteria group bacterium]|nr:hypothetical protein [Patescibacteria group bacterium]
MKEIVTPQDLPANLLEDFQSCAADADLAAQAFFRIRNQQGQLVQFLYNRAQRLLTQRAAGHPFVTVLKAKKVGVSSQRFVKDLWACATQKNQHRILLTYDDKSVGKLLDEKIMPLHDNCLVPLGGVFRRS